MDPVLQNGELKTKTSVSEVFVFNGLSQDHYPQYTVGRKKSGDVLAAFVCLQDLRPIGAGPEAVRL